MWRWPRAVAEGCRFVKDLRRRGYDCVLDFQGSLKSGVLGLLSGARDRVGFARGHCRELNWLFNNVWAMPSAKRMPRAEKFAALAQVIAPDLQLDGVSLREDAEAVAWVEPFLDQIPGDGPVVVLHPGTSVFGEFKRWPPERFGALAATLQERVGARCLVTQGPDEDTLAAQVVEASKGAGHEVEPLTIARLIELLRRAQAVVAGDTGPLHIAALLERPVVAIFGPKDPVVYAPYGTRCEMVRAKVDCSPCTRRECDDMRCIHQISVEAVREAAERLLRSGP